MRQLVKTFKALSDETRLRILNVIMQRECCVCEVMQTLEISQTRASRNLNALYDAGFLKAMRNGLWVLYSIDKDSLKENYIALMELVKKELADNKIASQDMQRLEKAERLGPGCLRTANKMA